MNETLTERAKKAFSRFSPFIRDYIYKSGWSELRRVQVEAAEILFFTENNLLISSETASGKTEAALFPVLSEMNEMGAENCVALYISPLKALINDQYSRMEELMQESDIPVTRWHGDVSQNKKSAFLKSPAGLLQITPESLESMLVRRSNDIPRIFAQLKYVLVDEIHSLMNSDRGSQIICQLQRIAKLIGRQPRRIALSATIGDCKSAAAWFGAGTERETSIIQIPAGKVDWKLGLEHFYTTDSSDVKGIDPATSCIYNATKNEKCIVFSNSREETEDVTASLRYMAKKLGEEDRFYIHHGNLSAAIREDAEDKLKNDEKAVTTCATVTLELGIDVGKLKRIINQGSPTSVSGFLQRIGRSGRRGEPPEMLMIFREEEALPNAPVYQLIPWDLLQAIAIIELYRKERWIEPAWVKPFPASLLFHQTLSVIASKGSVKPGVLAGEILSMPPFSLVEADAYKALLIHMIRQGYLTKVDDMQLMIGEKGERLLSSFKFFAVFKDSEDFTVRCGSEEIGTITATPPVGEHFALAGRVWEVEEIDVARRLIYSKPVEGKMKIAWPGSQGAIHTRILEKMREILESDEEYPYLLPKAKERLQKTRRLALNTGLTSRDILCIGGTSFVFFPWLGTRGFQGIKRILQYRIAPALGLRDIQSGGCYYICYRSDKASPTDVIQALKQERVPGGESLVGKTEYPVFDKFDSVLPQEMLIQAYAKNNLDLLDAERRIKTL